MTATLLNIGLWAVILFGGGTVLLCLVQMVRGIFNPNKPSDD